MRPWGAVVITVVCAPIVGWTMAWSAMCVGGALLGMVV